MGNPLLYERYSVVGAAAQIYQGEDPWYALGCFAHDWWAHQNEHRGELIAEPPPPAHGLEERKWAAFCAAFVEELCLRTNYPIPSWTKEPQYILDEPWFYDQNEARQAHFIETSLPTFKRRNLFFSRTVLDNKYEFANSFRKPGYLPLWTEEEMRILEKQL